MFSDFFDIYFFDDLLLATLASDSAGQTVTASPFILSAEFNGEYENIEVVAQPFAVDVNADACDVSVSVYAPPFILSAEFNGEYENIEIFAEPFIIGADVSSCRLGLIAFASRLECSCELSGDIYRPAIEVFAQPFIGYCENSASYTYEIAVLCECFDATHLFQPSIEYSLSPTFTVSHTQSAGGSAVAICPASEAIAQASATFGLSLGVIFTLLHNLHTFRDVTAIPWDASLSLAANLSKSVLCLPFETVQQLHALIDAVATPFTGVLSLHAVPSVSVLDEFTFDLDVDAYYNPNTDIVNVVNALQTGSAIDVRMTLLTSISGSQEVSFSILNWITGDLYVTNSIVDLYEISDTFSIVNMLRDGGVLETNNVYYLQTHGLS